MDMILTQNVIQPRNKQFVYKLDVSLEQTIAYVRMILNYNIYLRLDASMCAPLVNKYESPRPPKANLYQHWPRTSMDDGPTTNIKYPLYDTSRYNICKSAFSKWVNSSVCNLPYCCLDDFVNTPATDSHQHTLNDLTLMLVVKLCPASRFPPINC